MEELSRRASVRRNAGGLKRCRRHNFCPRFDFRDAQEEEDDEVQEKEEEKRPCIETTTTRCAGGSVTASFS